MTDSISSYKMFAEYYDLYVGNYTEDLDFYKSFCVKHDNILEIGCGTGRILEHLLKYDFKITGIDISDEMLEIAKNKLKKYEESGNLILKNHDYTYKPLDRQYDKVIITFYTFNYIINKPIDFLKNVNKSMKEYGQILMDLFYPQTLRNKLSKNKKTSKILKFNDRIIDLYDKRRMKNDIEYRTQIYKENSKEIKINTERKYFRPLEIKNYLEQVGFKNVMFSLTFDHNKFTTEIDEDKLIKNYIVKAVKQRQSSSTKRT